MNSIKPPEKIVLMEDHDKAYFAWKDAGVKGRALVHIDAHIDFGWLPDNDLSDILGINDPEGLQSLIKEQPLWNPFRKQKSALVNIGNYIFPALKEGIVDKFYWVVPEESFRTRRGKLFIKNSLLSLLRVKKHTNKNIKITGDYLHCRIFNKDIFVVSLDNLPILKEQVLLDIDTDFLLTPCIWDGLNPQREPWISPEQLAEKLALKKISTDILTIAYSVNGGFTPLRYKYLGDELKVIFEGKKDNSLQAVARLKREALQYERDGRHSEAALTYQKALEINEKDASLYFNLSLIYLNGQTIDFEKARHFYLKAVTLDKSYSCAYNNYGLLYQQIGKFKEAQEEYVKFLGLDSDNSNALVGLGYIALEKKKYAQARELFNKSLSLNKDNRQAGLGQAIAFLKTGKSGPAKEALLKLKDVPADDNGIIYWWLGRLSERGRLINEAIVYYKQAVLNQEDGPLVHLLLFRLYLIKRFYFRAFEEMKRFFYWIRLFIMPKIL